MELIKPTRAKAAYVEVERTDKAGGKPRKVKQHIIAGAGMFSTKEMEREAVRMADELGVPESRVKVEAYDNDAAPLEVNPRHRGLGNRWTRPTKARLVSAASPHIEHRRVFSVDRALPRTPEEWAEFAADFERRKQAQLQE